jgi:cytochrome c oxidase subunit IV
VERLIPYRVYWIAWGILLMLTVVMIVTEGARLPRVAVVAVILGAMVSKVTMIGGWYMHLKFERAALIACVVGGTFATAAVLFFLLVPDGLAALRLAPK